MSGPAAVIFDLDGTLIDSSEGIVNSVVETIDIMGLETLSREFIESCIGPPIGDSIGSKMGYSEETIRRFYDVFRPIYKDKHLMECEVFEGIPAMLEELQGRFRLGIATNKRIDYTLTLLDNLGLKQYFGSICGGDQYNKLKKPDILNNCMKELGVDPSGTVMVGDTDSDLNAAVQCNTDFIGVGFGFGFRRPSDIPEKYRFAATVDDLRRIILDG